MKYCNVFQNREIQEKYRKRDKVLPDTIVKVFGDNVKVNVVPKETKLVCKYNITDISQPSTLRTDYEQNMFKSMEIDGVLLDNLVTAYQFNTPGEHIVKYELYDETKVGNNSPLFAVDTLTNIFIPDSVISIGQAAFANCTGITSIGSTGSGVSLEIPNSVTTIGQAAFAGCNGLTSVTISSNIISIGNNILISCQNIETFNYNSPVELSTRFSQIGKFRSVIIGDMTTSIGLAAFQGKTTLENVIIGNNVTTIGVGAFKSCTSLTDVTIGNSVTTIEMESFSQCTSLTNITVPDSVISIGVSAFSNCTGLTNVTIGSGVTSIANLAFLNCTGLTSVTIPNSITSIGDGAFGNCSSLTSVTLNSNAIASKTYTNSSGLRNIFGGSQVSEYIIGNTVTAIGSYAFAGCTGLTSVVIGDSVFIIDNYAFAGTGLTSIMSMATTAPTITNNTFQSINTGGTLTVPSDSTGYDIWMGTGDYYLGKYNWTKVEQ